MRTTPGRVSIGLMLAASVLAATSCTSSPAMIRSRSPRAAPSVATADPSSDESTEVESSAASGSVPVATIAGLSIGSMTSDAEARKLYGDGLFIKSEGHSGGRYWVDPGRTVTLHAEVGDGSIESIELMRGVYLPPGLTIDDEPHIVASALAADPSVDHGLRLGMSARQVLDKLGPPVRDEQADIQHVLTYEAGGDSPYQATFVFVGDKLRRISIYDGEGPQ